MNNSDSICPSVKELDKKNAAFYKDGRFLWKSSSFLKMEKKLGEEFILDSVKMKKFPVVSINEDYEKVFKYIVIPAEKYDILKFSPKKITTRLKSKDPVDMMIKDIKNSVTNMSAQVKALSNILSEKGVSDEKIDETLKYINMFNMKLWVKTMFTDIIREYKLEMDLRRECDSRYIDAAFIAHVFEKHLNDELTGIVPTVTISSEGETFIRYLNSDHLRIILTLAVREILSMNLKTDFINVEVNNDKGTARISVTGGSMHQTPADLNILRNKSEGLKDLPVEEFIDLFCQKYNCKINRTADENNYLVEIFIPAYKGAITKEDRALVMANDKFKTSSGMFIPEFTVLCDIVDYEKIQEKKDIE